MPPHSRVTLSPPPNRRRLSITITRALKADQPTRGHRALEGYLARRRAQKAKQLIPEQQRRGRLLDVGCGSYPYFLATTQFAEKWGICVERK